MKKISPYILFLCFFNLLSQEFDRVNVNGKLIVESGEIAGITIYNASSNNGTITDDNGEFALDVGLNDLIEVSALQYQNINFRVNKDILQSRSMKIFLIEEINKLDEVIVFSRGLTGDLEADVMSKKYFTPKLDALYFGIKNMYEFEFADDNKSQVDNIAISRQNKPMVNGLDIVNVVDQLLLPLFRSEVRDEKNLVPDVPIKSIKLNITSEFIQKNFNIPSNKVDDFIAFVEGDSFDYNLLNYGNEMEFLELLYQKSLEYQKKN